MLLRVVIYGRVLVFVGVFCLLSLVAVRCGSSLVVARRCCIGAVCC